MFLGADGSVTLHRYQSEELSSVDPNSLPEYSLERYIYTTMLAALARRLQTTPPAQKQQLWSATVSPQVALASWSVPEQQQLLPPPLRTVENRQEVTLRLNNLQDNSGAIKQKRRIGRGVGSGRVNDTRGHKGQKKRGRRQRASP
jgi:hypothetical protein